MAALLALPLLAYAAHPVHPARAEGRRMNDVRQQVQVEASGGKVVVKLTLDNASGKQVFVPRAVYEDDEIFRREFAIKDVATGAEVDYIGPMVKRGPFTKDDFMAVKPGKKHSHSIDITRSYDFKPKRTYQLSYTGGYLGELAKIDAMSPAAVPAVTFTFTGK